MIHRNALRKAAWGSTSRVIGVGLGVSAGGVLHQLAGDVLNGWTMGIAMAVISFILMLIAEYEKETAMAPSEPSLKSGIATTREGEPAAKSQKLYHCHGYTSTKCTCKNT